MARLTREQKAAEVADFGLFCKKYLKIKTEAGEISPLDITKRPTQMKLARYFIERWAAKKPIRCIILKSRRQGVSTLVEAFFYWLTGLHDNHNAYILSNDDEGVSYLFDMLKLYHDNLDPDVRPLKRNDNRKILKFENPNDEDRTDNPGRRSEVRVASMNKTEIGSGYLAHLLHLSELAKCKNPQKALLSIRQAVPKAPNFSAVVIESTAYGAGNYFHQEWQRAERRQSDYVAFFFPWHEDPNATMEVSDDFAPNEIEKDLVEKYNLTHGQIAWRRRTIKNDCDGDEELFKQEYPASADEAFLVSGKSVFMPSTIEWYNRHVPKPKWEGDIRIGVYTKDGETRESSFFDEMKGGAFKMYEIPGAGNSDRFSIGADVAEGIDVSTRDRKLRGDQSVFHVINNRTGFLAAKWSGWVSADEFGKMLCAVGKIYNNAYIGVEANNHGLTTLTAMRDEGYPMNQIHHSFVYGEDYDDAVEKMGWLTNKRTKPFMIDNLIEALRHKLILGLDELTVGELRTFSKDAKGKMGGASGCYDDHVISLAITYMMVMHTQDANQYSEIPEGVDTFNKIGRRLSA